MRVTASPDSSSSEVIALGAFTKRCTTSKPLWRRRIRIKRSAYGAAAISVINCKMYIMLRHTNAKLRCAAHILALAG